MARMRDGRQRRKGPAAFSGGSLFVCFASNLVIFIRTENSAAHGWTYERRRNLSASASHLDLS